MYIRMIIFKMTLLLQTKNIVLNNYSYLKNWYEGYADGKNGCVTSGGA